MYTLDLETLSEDRLRKAVDTEIYNQGQLIFSRGQVQVMEATELSAVCVIHDKRNYRVEIKVGRGHVYLKCSCSHAGRGLICEHDVAAWMALREHLVRQQPSPWQNQLGQIITDLQGLPARQKASPYLLFFSLQEDVRSLDLEWIIQPYTLAWNSIPTEIRESGTIPDAQSLLALFTARPETAALRPKTVYNSLKPEHCLNCPADIANLANLMLERSRGYLLTGRQRFPLASYLALLRTSGCPLFAGTHSSPLQKLLQLPSAAAIAQLHIDRQPDGLYLSSHLAANEQLLHFDPEDTEVILEDPLWLRVGSYVVEMDTMAGISLLAQFREKPELHIPAEQENDFLEQYLLPLARQFPLQGGAITWQEVQTGPIPRLYLSDVNGELQGQLRFGYDDAEVRYDPDLPVTSIHRIPASLTLMRIHRSPEFEKSAHETLSSASFGLKRAPNPAAPGVFSLRARTHPVDFLLNMVPRLAEIGFEVYGEEQLKTARVNRSTPTISFNVSSGIDWFDVHAAVNFGELEVSFQEIRRALRKREHYIKLADGSIGELPEEWISRYKHLFDLGEATEDGLKLSRHHITLIEEALAEADRVELDAEYQRRRDRLRALTSENFQGITQRPLPPGFVGELRPYQKSGYEWLHFLHEFEFGGCLADDMGLGKTVQALVYLQSLYQDNPNRPEQASLLVVPRSLLVNWQREAGRFTPNLRILEFFDSDRVRDLSVFKDIDLVITTYGVMLRDIQLLHGYTFYYAILDESQAIKNPLSQTARAAHLLRASHRLVLTGTPIENSTSELWSQFAFLNPGLLGSLQYFKTEFGLPIEKKSDEKAVERLRKLVFPFILRRTKDQVAPELPPRTERIVYCDMSPAQRKLYNRMRDFYRGVLLGMVEKEGLNNSRMKILEGLLRLRQICNHPRLVDEKFHGESGKFELLVDTLETLRSEGHKALVFSQFVQMLSLVRKEIDSREIPYAYLDGQTQDRQERVDEFQANPDIPFFLISLRAGGLGLNLTAADYVIHIDPWWNPAVETQASDRTHRIGQDKPVFVYKLIARDSVEEKILQLQERKRNLVDQIITTESSFFKNLTQSDIEYLFGEEPVRG